MRKSNRQNSPACILLAAGKGTRMKSALPKVLHEVAGRPMIDHCLEAALDLAPSKMIVVVGHQADRVRKHVEQWKGRFEHITTALQSPQLGTGHAVAQALGALKGHRGPVVVLYGDVPLLRGKTLKRLVQSWNKNEAVLSFATMELDEPGSYGRVVRQKGRISEIIEAADATPDQLRIREVNAGIYCFDMLFLRKAVKRLASSNEQGEFYLTDTVALANAMKGTVTAIRMDPQEAFGVNRRADQALLTRILYRRNVERLMDAGVSIPFPDTVLVDSAVKVGRDTILEFGVQLLGNTTVGKDCRIQTGSIITDSHIASGAWIKPYSVVTESEVGPQAQVGPFSHLRPGTRLDRGAKVGNFVETKKTRLGPGVKANHLSYLGDAEIGEGTNVGAGTITCNYDGVHKHKTVIGKRVFIGSDTQLVAPVSLADDVVIGAGTTVLHDVDEPATVVNPKTQRHMPRKSSPKKKSFPKKK